MLCAAALVLHVRNRCALANCGIRMLTMDSIKERSHRAIKVQGPPHGGFQRSKGTSALPLESRSRTNAEYDNNDNFV